MSQLQNNDLSDNSEETGVPGVPVSIVTAPDDFERPRISTFAMTILGATLVLLFAGSGFLTYCFWPVAGENNSWKEDVNILSLQGIGTEPRMVILVLLGGLLGSLIHSGTSFSNYVGEEKLDKSWIWWYILRPFIGMAVALVFYLVFRGGLLTSTKLENINIYGVMTLATLSGLFSDRATLKLKEIFETLFQPKDDRKGKLENENDDVQGSNEAKA